MRLTLVSFTKLLLIWEEPFTWPDHDVMEYRISQTVDSETSETSITSQTAYSYHSAEIQSFCQNITFRVSAVSDLGPGPAASLVAGFPIGEQD